MACGSAKSAGPDALGVCMATSDSLARRVAKAAVFVAAAAVAVTTAEKMRP